MGYRSEVGYAIAFNEDLRYRNEVPDNQRLLTGRDMFNTFLMNVFSTIPNVGQFHSNIVLGDVKSNAPYPLDHLYTKK